MGLLQPKFYAVVRDGSVDMVIRLRVVWLRVQVSFPAEASDLSILFSVHVGSVVQRHTSVHSIEVQGITYTSVW
jgi:hypothetical protein